MYFIKCFTHVEHATRSKREVDQYLHDHYGMSWWDRFRGRMPSGVRVEYV